MALNPPWVESISLDRASPIKLVKPLQMRFPWRLVLDRAEHGGIILSGRKPTTQTNHTVTPLRCPSYWWRYNIRSGELVLALDDWSPLFDGYFIYYPSKRQNSAAFKVVVDALRHRAS
jgi:DNA-binding transcriptional LysR family regulator